MGGAVFPPYYLTWGQTMVEVKVPCRHRCTQSPLPCSRPLPTHASARDSWTLTGKSGSVYCGVTAPFSWVLVCTGFICALQESVFQSCVSYGGSMVGLMVTSSKRAYAIPRSTALRAPALAAVHCWPIPPEETLKHSSDSVSVGSLDPGVYKVCLSPLSVSGGMGFDSRCDFAPSTILLGFILCCWTWAVSSKSFQCCPASAPAVVLHIKF